MLIANKAANISEPASVGFGIDFLEVTKSHVEWRDKLRCHINGEALEGWSVNDAVAYGRCALGRWLRDAGRAQFGQLTAFNRLEMAHAEFHYFAGLIMIKTREGSREDAERILKNEFSQATRRILMEIGEMNVIVQEAPEFLNQSVLICN
jgi:hypothetical protein